MANFIIVGGEPSGFGSKTIKIKPTSVNTSDTTEKKGKLVIKVNGEVQRTIFLSQAVKTSTPTPGTVTLVSREIALEVREMTINSLHAEFTEVVNSDTYSKPITKPQAMNKRFTCNSKNATGIAKVTYSVSGIQTDYFSDGSNVKTNINPLMTTKPEDDDADWKISYSYKPESNLDIDDTFIYISWTLNITSNVILDSLPGNSTLKFTFTLEDVKTSKADVSYGMKLTVPCSLKIVVSRVDIFQPIIPSNPNLRPFHPDLNPQSDDDPIYVTE